MKSNSSRKPVTEAMEVWFSSRFRHCRRYGFCGIWTWKFCRLLYSELATSRVQARPDTLAVGASSAAYFAFQHFRFRSTFFKNRSCFKFSRRNALAFWIIKLASAVASSFSFSTSANRLVFSTTDNFTFSNLTSYFRASFCWEIIANSFTCRCASWTSRVHANLFTGCSVSACAFDVSCSWIARSTVGRKRFLSASNWSSCFSGCRITADMEALELLECRIVITGCLTDRLTRVIHHRLYLQNWLVVRCNWFESSIDWRPPTGARSRFFTSTWRRSVGSRKCLGNGVAQFRFRWFKPQRKNSSPVY